MLKKWKFLFATQFLGVFNDNLLKSLICFVSVIWLVDPVNPENSVDPSVIISLAGALLVAPFILFSALAGKLSLMYSKVKIVRIAKFFEIPIMILAISGFYFEQIELVLAALFFMGLQSSIFSPSKYGLIRDIGGVDGLSYGAGSMEMLSFLGVLIGTVIAGLISDLKAYQLAIVGGMLLSTAVFGWITSRGIKADEPEMDQQFNGTVNPILFLWKNFQFSKTIKGLNTTIFGIGTFWLVGAMLQMNLIVHCPETLNLSNSETSIVIAFVAIGIGLGCYVSGLLAKNKVELGLVPIGGLGLSICMSIIAVSELGTSAFVTVLIFGAFFSGLYKVPLTAWIQERVYGRKVGDILAYNNLVAFIFILASSLIFALVERSFGSQTVFVVIAALSWVITIITMLKIPAMMVRFLLYILSHSFFKIKLEGDEHIPRKTGALIVANHLSLLDAFLVVAAVPRMVRFVVHKKVYDHFLLNWWFKKLNIIPILPQAGAEALDEFNRICQEEINNGHVVCIFPEGQISRTGHIHEFKKGLEYIAKGIDAPIIPLHFNNVIGSAFSYYTGSSTLFKFRRSTLKRRVSIKVGEPMNKNTSAFLVRQKVIEMGAETFADRISTKHNLAYYFINHARENGDKMFTQNSTLESISFNEGLNDVLHVAKNLKNPLQNKVKIGLHIKDPYLKVIHNIALNLLGKTVINVDVLLELKSAELEPRIDIVVCDEEYSSLYSMNMNTIESIEITNEKKSSMIFSIDKLIHSYNPTVNKNQIATIVYEKQKDGKINEIHLSNQNILCNILGLKQVHKIDEDDSILAQLPFSTSFGYTSNLWLPACLGLKAFYNKLCEKNTIQPSIIIGWENNIDDVIQKHLSYQKLEGIKHVITGAIPLPPEKEEWIEKNWNTKVRYGFGMPECSPIVSINSQDFEIKDLTGDPKLNEGSFEGSVGRPLPGVAVKIIDEQTGKELEENEIGIILIKGPNVMPQHLSTSDKSFNGDWLVSPYKGSLNAKGFLTLAVPFATPGN